MVDFIPRSLTAILSEHLMSVRQMAFVTGPRQVGKTTTCRALADAYFDWDNQDHQAIILAGPGRVAEAAGLDALRDRPATVVFDELHKYSKFKTFIKGFFDTYTDSVRVIVTGSSRLDIYRRGADSLMGRYFPYHMHPLSVAELAHPQVPSKPVDDPAPISDDDFQALITHGGHPEPFFHRNPRFSNRWRTTRSDQLLRQDVREMTRIQELTQLDALAIILADRSGDQIVYANLARQVRMTQATVRNWTDTLSSLHFGFLVRPWHKNVSRSIRKEPKWYLRDWTGIADRGKRAETLVACLLLKACEMWSDLGFGSFGLYYIRDKQKREVDLLVVRDDEPWFLVEVKAAGKGLSENLAVFQKQLGCPHAFQVALEADYVEADCFEQHRPLVVPARTLLSQLV